MKYEGGYLMLRQPLIKRSQNSHTASLEDPIPDVVLRALNTIQSTSWRVNRIVYDTASTAWRNGDLICGLPSPEDKPLPARVPDEVWKKMTQTEILKRKIEMANIHGENARAQSAREEVIRKLTVAEELLDRTFWHVHNLDFRGRCYPVTQDLQPQSDDLAKGLHEFAVGLPLGKDGAFWLASRLASNFGNGMDKVNFKRRYEWAEENSDEIISSALDPLDGNRWWTTAEEPWQFLAACREWHGWKTHGEAFVSHLAVNLDGSINGAQHLSALGRDPVGAKLTNMTSFPDRQDLYSDVAALCNQRIEEDMLKGITEAGHWHGKVTRSTVKRGVMTTPYGVTDRGLRDQLIEDKHTEGLEGSSLVNANYFKTVLTWAIGQCVTGARSIMGFLQDTASAATEAELPFEWTGPLGMTVRQEYRGQTMFRINTLMGKLQVYKESKDAPLLKRKQSLAASPNFVHHLDAMHLYRTINRCHVEGIDHFLVVHDSYGCHAAHMGRMSRFIREEFVNLYKDDHLERLYQEQLAKGVAMPDIPPRGTFDVREVLDAEFFFS